MAVKVITVYRYSAINYEYIGQEASMEDSEYPDKLSIPDYTTKIPPGGDCPKYKAFVYNTRSKKWSLVNDFRGTWYNATNQEKREITKIGEYISNPEVDWTETQPTDPDAIWNGDSWIVPITVEIERKQTRVRSVRNKYLKEYVDTKTSLLHWEELPEVEKGQVREYRSYLVNYPESSEKWYEQNPKTWDEYFS